MGATPPSLPPPPKNTKQKAHRNHRNKLDDQFLKVVSKFLATSMTSVPHSVQNQRGPPRSSYGWQDPEQKEGRSPSDPPPTPLERPGLRAAKGSGWNGRRKSFKWILSVTESLLLFRPTLWSGMLLQKLSSCKMHRGCSARRIWPSSRWWLREPTSTLLTGSRSHSALQASRPICKEHRWGPWSWRILVTVTGSHVRERPQKMTLKLHVSLYNMFLWNISQAPYYLAQTAGITGTLKGGKVQIERKGIKVIRNAGISGKHTVLADRVSSGWVSS